MGTCRCGSKTIKFTPGKPAKASISKAPIRQATVSQGGQGKPTKPTAAQVAATKKATKAANANAAPCKCTQ
jgi:hypothetical protein